MTGWKSKLHSQKGESITEVLVATAIGGLALLMLAMAISAAVHMAVTSRNSLEDYYDANNVIAEAKGAPLGGGGAFEVTLVEEGTNAPVLLANNTKLEACYFSLGSERAGMDSVVTYKASSGGNP